MAALPQGAAGRLGWLLLGIAAASACGDPPKPEPRPAQGSPPPAAEAEPAPPALQCPAGFGDCDGQRGTGCETETDRAPAHCGHCGQQCGDAARCVAGACRHGTVAVSAGGSHTCLTTAAGEVACFGLNALGQLGLPKRRARLAPVLLPDIAGVAEVATGRYHTCLRYADGHVACSGDGGVLGGEERDPRSRFVTVAAVGDAISLDAGISHSCALERSGTAYCWGSDVAGQLGDGPEPEADDKGEPPSSFALEPVMVTDLEDAVAIAVGGAHTCALRKGGGVVCFGMGDFGQLGTGDRESHDAPVPVEGLRDVVQLALGQFHSCARTRDDALYCWGRNASGQLGLGDRDDRTRPQRLALEAVAEVSCGQRHCCARLRDGKVLCFGDNESGQLGDGTTESRARPTPVYGLEDAIAVAAGETHSCAVREDGSVTCFGHNDGQLGDGGRTSSPTPVAVAWRAAPPGEPQASPGPRRSDHK